jgi:hypothetical protein
MRKLDSVRPLSAKLGKEKHHEVTSEKTPPDGIWKLQHVVVTAAVLLFSTPASSKQF